MSDPHLYQQIGHLQAKVEGLERGQVDATAERAAMNGKLDTLLERSAKERGGRGMLWKVGTIGGAIGSLLMALAQWWQGK
jgi:hypothetical protein